MKYVVASSHVETLADGTILEPSQVVELSDELAKDQFNARLIEDGVLTAVQESKQGKKKEDA